MAAQFSRNILKISVAQICQNVGWHAVHQSTLEILADILHRYMLEVAKSAQAYSNHYGRTEPDLEDVWLSFVDLGIVVSELEEYVSNVEPVHFVQGCLPHFPVARPSDQPPHHWLRDFSSAHPTDLEEEEELALSPGAVEGGPSPRKEGVVGASNSAGEEMPGSPDGSPQPGKRASEGGGETPTPKRFRLCMEEEGQPMREVTSVFMTPSGLISPAREGRLPEPSLPSKLIVAEEAAADSANSPEYIRKENKLKEVKKSLKKEAKKVKPSKKDKENADLLKKGLFFPTMKTTHTMFKFKKKLSKKAKFPKEVVVPKLKMKEPKSKSKGSKSKEEKKEGKSKEGKSKEGKTKEKTKSKKNKGGLTVAGPSTSLAVAGLPLKVAKGKSPGKTKNTARCKTPKGEKKKSLPPVPLPVPPAPPPPPLSPAPITPFTLASMTPLQVMACKAEEERLRLNAATQQAPLPQPPPLPPPPDLIPHEELYDIPSRDESPEPRLVIDDSPEMISKQERESRLADIEQCIDAVIQKAREQSMQEEKRESAAEALLAHGTLPRKLEPRDVYDFTDSDSDSSMPATPKTPDLAGSPNPKKDTRPSPEATPGEHKKKESGKTKKKSAKAKSGSGTPSPKKGGLPKTPELRGSPLVALSQRAESPERGPSFSGVFPFSQHGGNLFSPRFTGLVGSPQQQQGGGFLPAFPFPHLGRSGVVFPTPPLFVPPVARGPTSECAPPGSPPSMGLPGSPFPVKTVAEKKGVPCLPPSAPPRLSKEAPLMSKGHQDAEKGKGSEPKEKNPVKKKGKESKGAKKPKAKTGKEKKTKEEKKDDSIPKITVKLTSKPSATKLLLKAMSQSKEHPEPVEEAPQRRSPSPPLLLPSVPPTATPPPPAAAAVPLVAAKGGSKGGSKGGASSASKGASKQSSVQPAAPSQLSEPPSSLPAARMVVTETVGTIVDERGNKIWICPACARPDDGSPMIGCDECDDWYHWVCVGIVVPPKEEESWFCNRCIAKRQGALAKKKKKKHRKEK